MKKITVLCPFKTKDNELLSLEHHYIKQLKSIKLSIIENKSFGENVKEEEKWLEAKLDSFPKNNIFLLREKGKNFNSLDFEKFIYSCDQELVLVFSGAVGFSEDFLSKFTQSISLSPLTFPHKLARLLLIEQIYRSACINSSHPYHN